MAATADQNPAVKSESKSAKKKKVKAEPSATTVAVAQVTETAPSTGPTESNNGDGVYESPYIKELYKNIRNVNKKITNASKVDNILAENPGKTLDELVAARKINADQKAQILKKPALQASLAQLEEQIAQYKKFDQEYRSRSQAEKDKVLAEKAEFEKTYSERAAKELGEKIAAAKAEAIATAQEEQRASLLIISQFLRLAAVRRGDEEADHTSDENRALEGVLAKLYNGDEHAVIAMLNLIQGTDEKASSVEGEVLTTTYAEIKHIALAQISHEVDQTTSVDATLEATATETAEHPVESDPTIANAGLTELDAPTITELSNGHETARDAGVLQNAGIDEGAANAVAEAHWDAGNDLSTSQEWVEVPRDATETETGLTATPAAPSNIQSWADDQPDTPTELSTSAATNNGNDGFHEVHRNRGGRERGDGQFRGRGGRGGDGNRGRGGFRGDGYRGGRGRGGPRGGGERGDGQYRGRGGRRPDES